MIRPTIKILVALAAVAAAAAWLGDRPGDVSIRWQGWLVEMSVGRFALALVAAVGLALVVAGLVRVVGGAPGRFQAGRRAARRERGYRALTRGMVAVAAGDPGEALRQARRADVLLQEPPLTMLLSAQAAQLNGEEAAARHYFTAMLERPETAFLGLRGLLVQAQRDGDRRAALDYADQAYRLRPATPWVVTTLLDLQVRDGRWRAALETLEKASKRKVLAAGEWRGRHAAVLMGCSDDAGDNVREAMRFARRARALATDFLPASLRIADILARANRKRRAERMIREAWRRAPHPELARIYLEIGGGDALSRVRRCERLFSFNPQHEESHVQLAQAALAAGLWGKARAHLEKAAADEPSMRIFRLMAELEEREHGDAAKARDWLLRASTASPDPAWVCNDCGGARENWRPLCEACGALGELVWRTPASGREEDDSELLLAEIAQDDQNVRRDEPVRDSA